MHLLLILMLIFTAAAKQHVSVVTVRVGDEVILPCNKVTEGRNNCDRTSWSFISSTSATLFEAGQIQINSADKSDRLKVTVNCYLVIKKVIIKDVGQYTCRQLTSEPNFVYYLSVIHMTEQKINNSVVFNCSVVDYNHFRHTVEWLYEGKGETSSQADPSPPSHRSTVALTTSLHQKSAFFRSIKCKVTNNSTEDVQLFTFIQDSPVQNTGFPYTLYVLRCIIVPVGLVALLISVFTVNTRTKRNAQVRGGL
ncbi:uncharacterized protein LOC124882240 isoform X3 [Girardinichthys multiradiatus]|uniref:uncharacterized protein LOC124882240 isoform X3 n=1 Tax=Girardinichthys multiradiatus TaxID=208333 RepID=UPI001FAE604D|nr:uncharacterized protein LOC124882240 isoform X3 [Girardinichthys multiradiatus]